MEKIRRILEIHINKLERLGIDYLTNREEYLGWIIMIFFNLLLYGILFILIPLKYISIPLISILFIITVLFLWIDYKDEYGNFEKRPFMFFLGITLIPFAIISYYILMRIVPYRGKNKMLIRKSKLRILIRKSKINKLKFWK